MTKKNRPPKSGPKTIAGATPATPTQLEARAVKVGELYLTGMTMMEIGRQLGISTSTVYTDLQLAHEHWRTRCADAIEKLKQGQLSRVDWIEMEATKAWRRSIGNHVKKISKTGNSAGPAGGPYEETATHEEELEGNPKFLDIIDNCVDKRCKIIGLYAPAKVAGPDGINPLVQRIEIEVVGKSQQAGDDPA